ncbi:MAG: M28 family peptidase [Ignavibacteriaceae bacterium]|nr:M28 family peptidase [Ignavibacteriaceae bacterium]
MYTKSFSKILIVLLVFQISLTFAQIKESERSSNITRTEIKSHSEYLASDELMGRATGTKGADLAKDYIEKEFKHYNLKPVFDNSFFQKFTFTADVELTTNNKFSITRDNIIKSLKISNDFITAPFSGSATVEGELVIIGYGIAADKLQYNDYDSIDVKDKIVLAIRYNPEYNNPHTMFEEYSSFRFKAAQAKERGAKAIIFVNGHFPELDSDELMKFVFDRAAGIKDFPVVHVKRNIVDELFEKSGKNFKEYQKNITDNKKPESFILANAKVSITTEVKPVEKIGYNVAGLIEGNHPTLKNEIVVVGGHYDHLGMGGDGSLYRGSEPQIHNGADDNASGTTGVLELAQKFASMENELNRSYLFIGFGGEELGLLGSNYFVNNSPLPIENMIAMINLDMIGRLNSDTSLIVYGTGTSKSWDELLLKYNTFPFKLTKNPEGYGPSDHSSFYAKAIPVLFFFTGTHSDYHRPSDDADKINFEGQEEILNYIYRILGEVDKNEFKPEYVNVPRKEQTSTGGWKVYVGTIPDYAYTEEGLKITGVNQDSPAQKAGLVAGDIILEFGQKKITNIYDYVYALKEFVPGDIVSVKVKRGSELQSLSLELGAR